MTSKFDSAVNKILGEDSHKLPWYYRAIDKVVPDEWGRVDDKGMAGKGAGPAIRGFKKGVGAGSMLIPGTAGVKALQGAKKGYDAYKAAKKLEGGMDMLRKGKSAATKGYDKFKDVATKGKGAGETINRRPIVTGLTTGGINTADELGAFGAKDKEDLMNIKTAPAVYAVDKAVDKGFDAYDAVKNKLNKNNK